MGTVIALLEAFVIMLVVFLIGLYKLKHDARKPPDDPLNKESNYWW